MMRKLVTICLILAPVFFLASCSTPKPTKNAFADAEQAMAAAERMGAEEHAPVELRFAREKLAEAHKGMEMKQSDKSIYLIEQSEINSELAIEKTRAAMVRGQVAELARQNEILREDYQATFGEDFE